MLAHDKPHLAAIVIGPLNSGKSTLCGAWLHQLGGVDDRTVSKMKTQITEYGLDTNPFALVMNRIWTPPQAQQCLIDDKVCHTKEFFTRNRHFTLLDAPGNQHYRKTFIRNAFVADIVIVVVSAVAKEFDAGIEDLKEQLLICRAFGIEQIIVCVNKMDDKTVNYKERAFNTIKAKMEDIFKSVGYDSKKIISFIPISALQEVNLIHPSNNMIWFKNEKKQKGKALIGAFECVTMPKRFDKHPFRMYIRDIWWILCRTVVSGKVQSGQLKTGEYVQYKGDGTVSDPFSMQQHHKRQEKATSGMCIGVKIKRFSMGDKPKVGDLMILKKEKDKVKDLKYFTAHVYIDYVPKQLKKGSSVCLYFGTNHVTAKIVTFRWKKRKDEKIEFFPQKLVTGDNAEILFVSHKLMPIFELEKDGNERLIKIVGLEKNKVVLHGSIMSHKSFNYPFGQILVYGYIRIDIQKAFKMDIIDDLKNTIAHFFGQ